MKMIPKPDSDFEKNAGRKFFWMRFWEEKDIKILSGKFLSIFLAKKSWSFQNGHIKVSNFLNQFFCNLDESFQGFQKCNKI